MPLITLLTDFGTSDSYVAEMKGVLLAGCPAAVLVDVTHAVPPGDVRAGAYLLGRAWSRFPAATVHLAVVDPGVGTERAALALRAHGHWFVGPDNGVFTRLIHDSEVEAVMLPVPSGASPTFHGRDLFAPAAAALANGTALDSLGQPFAKIPARLTYTEPHYEGKSVVGEIVYVDRFGTLVTNLSPALVPPYAVLEVEGLEIGPLRRTFGDVPTGGLLAYVGSAGDVEIAVRDGSAARRLGLGVGGRIRARLG
jgi:S-adenosylmethionine hydrolase